VLLLNEGLLLFISLSTQSGNFWIYPCIANIVFRRLYRNEGQFKVICLKKHVEASMLTEHVPLVRFVL